MPTYEDGTCNTLTADWHEPTECSRCGLRLLSGEGIHPCGAETCPRYKAIGFAQNTRDEVRLQGEGTISRALSAQPGMKQTTYVAQPVSLTQYGEEVAGTLTARHDSSPCADRGQNMVVAQNSNGEDVVGALCARDYKGVGNEYVGEGKVICQTRTS